MTYLDRRSQMLSLLDAYSNWLMENGYMDTDWRDEPPFAIDEFIKELEHSSKYHVTRIVQGIPEK